MPRPRLVIAGTHSGAGKTTVTLALMAALKAKGMVVQPFKAGPDFIDPGHHQAVTGRPSRNLDGWMLGESANRAIFARASADADLSIINFFGRFLPAFSYKLINSWHMYENLANLYV